MRGVVWGLRGRAGEGSETREGRGADGCSGEMEEEDEGHSANKKADGRFECVAQRGRPMLIGVYFFLFRPHILIPCRPSAVPLPSKTHGRPCHGQALHGQERQRKRKRPRPSSR